MINSEKDGEKRRKTKVSEQQRPQIEIKKKRERTNQEGKKTYKQTKKKRERRREGWWKRGGEGANKGNHTGRDVRAETRGRLSKT